MANRRVAGGVLVVLMASACTSTASSDTATSVEESPPPSTSVTSSSSPEASSDRLKAATAEIGGPGCEPSSPVVAWGYGLAESVATSADLHVWALLSTLSPLQTGAEVKIVWVTLPRRL